MQVLVFALVLEAVSWVRSGCFRARGGVGAGARTRSGRWLPRRLRLAQSSRKLRAADLRANQLYSWRRDMGHEHAAAFAAVMVSADPQGGSTPVSPAAAMVIEIGRTRVKIMANAPLALVSTTLRVLAR